MDIFSNPLYNWVCSLSVDCAPSAYNDDIKLLSAKLRLCQRALVSVSLINPLWWQVKNLWSRLHGAHCARSRTDCIECTDCIESVKEFLSSNQPLLLDDGDHTWSYNRVDCLDARVYIIVRERSSLQYCMACSCLWQWKPYWKIHILDILHAWYTLYWLLV